MNASEDQAPGWRLVAQAIELATRAHRHQVRKDGCTPYVGHVLRVGWCLEHLFGVRDPEVLAAGVLHDVIEDTTVDYDDLIQQFGPRVAQLVAALTKDKRLPEAEREAQYHRQLAQAPAEAWLIKLADLHENLSDLGSLPVQERRRIAHNLQRTFHALQSVAQQRWPQACRHVAQMLHQALAGTKQTAEDEF